jgi:hypothetical protein
MFLKQERLPRQANPSGLSNDRCGLRMHDGALPLLLKKLHDDRRDRFGPGNQKQMTVVDYV